MKTYRNLFSIGVVFLWSTSASANAGTPLMWASMFHLVFGNAVIGIVEGCLLASLFKASYLKSIPALIAANYVSMWIGLKTFGDFLTNRPDITIENIQFWLVESVIFAFIFTLIIEWPFFYFPLFKKKRAIVKSMIAVVAIHSVSYSLLIGYYWNVSATKMITNLNVVSADELAPNVDYLLYYIASDGDKILKSDLKGNNIETIQAVSATNRDDRLFASETSKFNLYVLLNHDRREEPTKELVAEDFSELAPIDILVSEHHVESPERTWFNFGPAPSLAPGSAWKFETGFWAAEGIRCENEKENLHLWFSLETPFAQWIVRNATQLEGDRVVFQLGENQICLLDPNSKKIALIARGKGPIVALPKSSGTNPAGNEVIAPEPRNDTK